MVAWTEKVSLTEKGYLSGLLPQANRQAPLPWARKAAGVLGDPF